MVRALFKYHESLLLWDVKYRPNAERGSSSHGNVVDLFSEYSSLQHNCKQLAPVEPRRLLKINATEGCYKYV